MTDDHPAGPAGPGHHRRRWRADPVPAAATRAASSGAGFLTAVLLAFGAVSAQTAPDAQIVVLRPELESLTCRTPQFAAGPGFNPPPTTPTEPLTPEQEAQRAQRQAYRDLLPSYLARLPAEPDELFLMPVEGVLVSQVANTFSAPRGGGRSHQGQDIFAPRGTAIRSATTGIVHEISHRFTGGRGVMILGPGGYRYFYTHLEAYAEDLREGMWVTTDTVIGYVGNDGNASTTPTHLHFGVYAFDWLTCRHRAFDPLPFLIDR